MDTGKVWTRAGRENEAEAPTGAPCELPSTDHVPETPWLRLCLQGPQPEAQPPGSGVYGPETEGAPEGSVL